MRLELTRPNGHYPLKVARLPIPPLLHNYAKLFGFVPRTGLEPARLSTLAPETSASTIPPPGHLPLSGKRGSNSRPQPWQGCALPTELFPRFANLLFSITFPCQGWNPYLLRQVVLYQLSYFRVFLKARFSATLVT